MAGPNTTGKPRTKDYSLGRGVVMFAELDAATGLPKGFRDLGNAPEFNVSAELESLEHQSSRGGLRVTDKEVILSQKLNLSITLDEVNFENVSLFFSGDKEDIVNPAVAGITSRTLVPAGQVELGKWYDIRNSAGVRVVDISAGNLTISDTSGLPPIYTLDDDYELDLKWGRIFLPLTSDFNVAQGLTITLTAKPAAKTPISTVRGLTKTAVVGALRFVAENPANNDEQTEYTFHQVSLKADGDFALIGDEFTQMSFAGVAERNALADPTSPTVRIRHYDQGV
jgi:hypothetical protein